MEIQDKNPKKKILITGIDGFIGNHLKNYFKSKGWDTWGTVFFKEPIQGEQEIHLDVSKETCFEEFSNEWNGDFPIIIHAIGIMNQEAPRKTMWKVNTLGTRKMVNWAKNHGCKHFIYLSTIAVHGPFSAGNQRNEEDWWIYKSLLPYGRTKGLAEKEIIKTGIPYSILRMPAVLGSHDTALSPAIIPRILNEECFRCGSGERKISLLLVDLLGPIIEELIQNGALHDACTCSSHQVKWNEFIGEFSKILGKKNEVKKKSILSIFSNLHDKGYLLIAAFSRWGAHFPSVKLLNSLNGIKHRFNDETWKEGVKDAINGFLKERN